MKKKENKKDAMLRAAELYTTPMGKLPKLAREFDRRMRRKYGGCGEVTVTAFAYYAQLEEGLPCESPHYRVNDEDAELFRQTKAEIGE